jgi:hypothetical protein
VTIAMDDRLIGGNYTGRVLKGAEFADLPVQQIGKEGPVVNLKTANALDRTVLLSLIGRTDEVIE